MYIKHLSDCIYLIQNYIIRTKLNCESELFISCFCFVGVDNSFTELTQYLNLNSEYLSCKGGNEVTFE